MKNETRYIFSKGDLFQKDFSIQFKGDEGNTYIPIKDVKELFCFNDVEACFKEISVFLTASKTTSLSLFISS